MKVNKKRVLLMDEVDGMAGNEDRGGVAELINLIKITKVRNSVGNPHVFRSSGFFPFLIINACKINI